MGVTWELVEKKIKYLIFSREVVRCGVLVVSHNEFTSSGCIPLFIILYNKEKVLSKVCS